MRRAFLELVDKPALTGRVARITDGWSRHFSNVALARKQFAHRIFRDNLLAF